MISLLNRTIIHIIFFSRLCGQIDLYVSEFRLFPDEIQMLDLQPDMVQWSVAGRFLLLDKMAQQLIGLGLIGDVQMVGGFGRQNYTFVEPVWMGVTPGGILVVDRLDNRIISLDYRLNFIHSSVLEPRIFPELAAVDPWGELFLYSSQYHSIFSVKRGVIDPIPHIDLNTYSDIRSCVREVAVNQDGTIGVLTCDDNVHLFSKLGQYRRSIPALLSKTYFLVPLRNDWFVFDQDGNGVSILDNVKLEIPGVSVPVMDIKGLNRSIAVLSKDHILILNVQYQ